MEKKKTESENSNRTNLNKNSNQIEYDSDTQIDLGLPYFARFYPTKSEQWKPKNISENSNLENNIIPELHSK